LPSKPLLPKEMTRRVLVIQLARLGDLVQTIPAITALKESHADWDVDLLCPAPLADIGQLLPGISAVVKWDGAAWHRRAASAAAEVCQGDIASADAELRAMTENRYDCAFVLNQHTRSILAGALLARENIGAITGGPQGQKLSPWALYIRSGATAKQSNRIHLADAFCGMCSMPPPKQVMPIRVPETALPTDLDPIGQSEGPWVGVLVGAGDRERLVPVAAWERMITECLENLPASRIVLVGDKYEQERAQYIQESLPPFLLGRIWDTTGRLSLIQLASLLTRCQIVIGADTGPLHLAAAVGTRVIGWYFARAHVHDTGPYGPNHWVWQAERGEMERMDVVQPSRWPITETIALLRGHYDATVANWSLWESYRDHWGTYYVEAGQEPIEPLQREQVWRQLQPSAVL
jgi:heptosyltransferase-1